MRLSLILVAATALLFACGEGLPENPQLQPDRTAILFGGEFADAVYVGTVKRETLQLKNDGADTLTVNEVTVGGADAALFTAKIDTKSIGSEQKAFVELSYAPTAAGKHEAELTITSNAANSPTLKIPLKGTAVAPPAN